MYEHKQQKRETRAHQRKQGKERKTGRKSAGSDAQRETHAFLHSFLCLLGNVGKGNRRKRKRGEREHLAYQVSLIQRVGPKRLKWLARRKAEEE